MDWRCAAWTLNLMEQFELWPICKCLVRVFEFKPFSTDFPHSCPHTRRKDYHNLHTAAKLEPLHGISATPRELWKMISEAQLTSCPSLAKRPRQALQHRVSFAEVSARRSRAMGHLRRLRAKGRRTHPLKSPREERATAAGQFRPVRLAASAGSAKVSACSCSRSSALSSIAQTHSKQFCTL